ncbi:Thioredoxin domain-containing protein 3-like [Oopsacas minuta]|uniref:Thioredoxin domain-containing protein 3-like n=1 Tax=Oopsacas minuta TaxID=111878 RepID=A0AAV7JD61_9METZ|nr:Thioredoxin domain-containing protein 3-like [Oopsacas minuta]
MPPKQIHVQTHINSEEEWKIEMEKKGLHVVDVYADWAGPCKSVTGLFKKLKTEIGDPLLMFETASSDKIAQLEPYRNRCQPAFLLFAGGCLVGVIHGCKGPKLEQIIKSELEKEKKILEHGMDRIQIEDTELLTIKNREANLGTEASTEEPEEEMTPLRKEFTICIIKPDIVEAGKVDEILNLIRQKFIEILAQKEETLSEQVTRELYSHLEEEDFFPELLTFMTGGPSVILLLSKMGLTGEGIIQEFRDIIGPFDIETAKEQSPQSIRALYSSSNIQNAIHSSSSVEQAARELAFFFPESSVPYVRGTVPEERTLALIRPDVLADHRDELLQRIRDVGFEISFAREVQLTKEQVEDFYISQREEDGYEKLLDDMSSGPVLALCLAGKNVVQAWVNLIQPCLSEKKEGEEEQAETEMKKQSIQDMINEILPEPQHVPIYGSATSQTAVADLDVIFPEEDTIAVIKPNAFQYKDTIIDKIKDLGFNVKAQNEQVLNQELFEAFYKQHEGQDFYENLRDFMTSGPSLVLLLSDRHGVSKWRDAMGPTDPSENKQGLRGVFGNDTLANGLHGTSNTDKVQEFVKLFFTETKPIPSEEKQIEIDNNEPEDDEVEP